jgi:hypothetical protein
MHPHEASTKQLHIRVAKALDILTSETAEPMDLESMNLGYKVTDFSVNEQPVEQQDSGSGSDECEYEPQPRPEIVEPPEVAKPTSLEPPRASSCSGRSRDHRLALMSVLGSNKIMVAHSQILCSTTHENLLIMILVYI